MAGELQGRGSDDDHRGDCWPQPRWSVLPRGDEALLGHQSTLADGWGRSQGLDRVSEQHDWVVGVGLVLSSCRGSTNQLSTSCDQINGDLIE